MRIEKILKNPQRNDEVYRTLQRLFKYKSQYNLSRDKAIQRKIRRLAWKRFILGYPPRKPKDTSLGDSLNWEWIVHCAMESMQDIIIVTRDQDYGVVYSGEAMLNDWLAQEFKERVSGKGKLTITHELTTAFKLAHRRVSKKDQRDEKEFLKEGRYYIPTEYSRSLEPRFLSGPFETGPFIARGHPPSTVSSSEAPLSFIVGDTFRPDLDD